MSSGIPFDFVVIQQRQQSSSGSVDTAPYSDDGPLQYIREARDDDSALSLLNEVIEQNDSVAAAEPDIDLLHRALLMRARVHKKKRNIIRAKNDVERAIVTKPKHVFAYGLLGDIEVDREQFGRAEVALRLGLLMDPNNVGLKEKLNRIRSRDFVHPDVSHHARTDGPVRAKQHQAGRDLVPPFHPLIMAAMTGNVEALRRNWVTEMKDFKHGSLKNPLMHFPVLGLQRLTHGDQALKEELLPGCKAVIDFLYDRGARLDGQDYCGYTAVMHGAGSLPQPELLEHLLSKGADPNLKSTFGTVALMDAAMNQNVDVVEVLMRHKADPYIADNDGIAPIKFAENYKLVLAAFHKYLYPEMPSRICARCPEAGRNRCAKCRVVFYCSKKCQKNDWKSHKPRCSEIHKSHKRLAFIDAKYFFAVPNIQSTILRNFVNEDIPGSEPQALEGQVGKLFDSYNEEVKKHGNLLVKIQVGLNQFPDATVGSVPDLDYNRQLAVYNKSKSFRCFLDPHKLDGQELISIIKEKGVGGKGYFWSFMESGEPHLTVITDPVHRAQPW